MSGKESNRIEENTTAQTVSVLDEEYEGKEVISISFDKEKKAITLDDDFLLIESIERKEKLKKIVASLVTLCGSVLIICFGVHLTKSSANEVPAISATPRVTLQATMEVAETPEQTSVTTPVVTKTPKPTSKPKKKPRATLTPTVQPTAVPTAKPTVAPTKKPTPRPTEDPFVIEDNKNDDATIGNRR